MLEYRLLVMSSRYFFVSFFSFLRVKFHFWDKVKLLQENKRLLLLLLHIFAENYY